MVDEGRQYVDAIYFVMMTLTSVGYGDITPQKTGERLFVYILMICTAFFYAYVIGTFADLIANKVRKFWLNPCCFLSYQRAVEQRRDCENSGCRWHMLIHCRHFQRRDRSAFEQKMRSVFAFLEMVECPDDTQQKIKAYYLHR